MRYFLRNWLGLDADDFIHSCIWLVAYGLAFWACVAISSLREDAEAFRLSKLFDDELHKLAQQQIEILQSWKKRWFHGLAHRKLRIIREVRKSRVALAESAQARVSRERIASSVPIPLPAEVPALQAMHNRILARLKAKGFEVREQPQPRDSVTATFISPRKK